MEANFGFGLWIRDTGLEQQFTLKTMEFSHVVIPSGAMSDLHYLSQDGKPFLDLFVFQQCFGQQRTKMQSRNLRSELAVGRECLPNQRDSLAFMAQFGERPAAYTVPNRNVCDNPVFAGQGDEFCSLF